MTDHPHGRGENLKLDAERQTYSGPSPRAWGKQRLAHCLRPRTRTIPTGVGKTPAP